MYFEMLPQLINICKYVTQNARIFMENDMADVEN